MTSAQPSKFMMNTDYRALMKEPTGEVIEHTIPGSIAIAAGGSYEWTGDVEVGSLGSLGLHMIYSEANGRGFHYVSSVNFIRTGTVGGASATYNELCLMSRVGPTTVRATVLIKNPYGSTLTTATSDHIYFVVVPLVPPYE